MYCTLWKTTDMSGTLPSPVLTFPFAALLPLPLKCSPYSSSLNSFCSSHLLSPNPVSLSYLFPFGIFPCSSLEGLLATVLFGHSLSCSCRDVILRQALCVLPWRFVLLKCLPQLILHGRMNVQGISSSVFLNINSD